MISKQDFKNLIHKLHIDSFVESHKRLHEDNRGGFLIPIEFKIKDKEYERYRHLPVNWSISPITKNDLPKEFSQKAVNTVDIFRRKTFGLDVECMIYFDICTGNIISCNFSKKNNSDTVSAEIFPDLLKGAHLASIHNHPKAYYSQPSGKNFQMLGFEFEEYEIISSDNELWILESKDIIFNKDEIEQIRKTVDCYFHLCFDEVCLNFKRGYEVIDNSNELYANMLLNYFNKFDTIKLMRRIFSD